MLYEGLFRRDWNPTVVSFNYGQRHVKELDAAATICNMLGLQHYVVDLEDYGWILSKGSSTLVNSNEPIPEGRYDGDNMKATVVPNRNMTMLSLATGICIALDGHFVATAVHAGDHAIYPDCRPDFIGSFAETARIANAGFLADDFNIDAPFIYKTKTDIAELAGTLGVPIGKTWSCYVGGENHCGRCGTCVERLEAINNAGVAHLDDTVYEDTSYWMEVLAK
jgi:7-cyano-7-deazaguanine synthase